MFQLCYEEGIRKESEKGSIKNKNKSLYFLDKEPEYVYRTSWMSTDQVSLLKSLLDRNGTKTFLLPGPIFANCKEETSRL